MPTASARPLLTELLRRVAESDPHAPALEIPGRPERAPFALTYGQLWSRAVDLAEELGRRLDELSAGEPEATVGLLMGRTSPGLLTAQVACLLAGAPYLAIDPGLPDDHAGYLVEDAGLVLLLADEKDAIRAGELGRGLEVLARDWRCPTQAGSGSSRAPSLPPVPADRIAYLIYTSGTTGRPKGVAIEQASLANLIGEDLEIFKLRKGDRVAQGSSPSYDSSLEENWMALSSGATVVVMDEEAARAGPDLVAWLREQRITVLCPPPTQLRTTGCTDPATELPDLRWIYVGGEALPPDLAGIWGGGSQGRRGPRLVNGYGPTECTVTVLRSEVHDPADVRIGRPVRGNHAWVVGPDGEVVPDGEEGELWITGAGLARGYHGMPELTADRFPVHRLLGRAYRTGDLVRRARGGEIVYVGRADSQVQLRGHRIELGAVEAGLAEQPGVAAAAAAIHDAAGRPQLVAWLVAERQGVTPDLARLRADLLTLVPEPMVPVGLAWIDELPTSVGGKLDRSRLPAWRTTAASQAKQPHAPRSAGDPASRNGQVGAVAGAFAQVLGLDTPPPIDADFFDLGGDSLAAATLISLLRNSPDTAHLAVRDLYEARTAAGLAQRTRPGGMATPAGGDGPAELTNRARDESAGRRSPASRPTTAGPGRRLAFTTAQAAWITFELLAAAALVRWLLLDAGFRLFESLSPWLLLLIVTPTLIWVPLLLAPAQLGLTWLARQLVMPRYRPGRYPAFGAFHLRHWLVTRLARRLPWNLARGTRLFDLMLRALGARVGRGVHVHRGVDVASGGWNLLELEDGVNIEQDAALRLVELDGGELVVGGVRMGEGSSLAVRASMGPDTALGSLARLEPLAYLEPGTRVPGGERWSGTPAARVGDMPAAARSQGQRLATEVGLLGWGTLLSWLRSLPVVILLWLSLGGSGDLASALRAPSAATAAYLTAGLLLCLALVLDIGLVALMVRALGRRVAAAGDRFDLNGPATGPFVALWLATGLVDRAGTWLSGTLFWPPWLRLAGMKVGRGAEISTVINLLPRDVEVGDESFLADGIYLGCARLHGGVVARGHTRLGRVTFIGNHAVIPAGSQLPDDLLVGVCTVATDLSGPGAWFGQPPFQLPRSSRQEMDRSLTHEPSLLRRLNRLAWEAARLALPLTGVALAWLLCFLVFSDLGSGEAAGAPTLLRVGLALLGTSGAALLAVLALKWLLLGRVRPGRRPLWSCWCSRWDFLYVVWGALARPVLATLDGSLLQSLVLRLFGVRIGPGVLLGGGFAQVVDPDMLCFEAGATVAGIFQAHTFEDRVLKIDHLSIGQGATLGAGALAFYGVRLETGSRARPGGVALKGETLAAGRDHAGVPLVPS